MASDLGIKVAQAGHDVQDAGDSELLFSSSWPVPKILFQGRIKATIASSPAVIVNHNLGYVPMFLPYSTSGNTFKIFREIISGDEKSIYYSAPGGSGTSGPIDFGLFIFDIDITKNFLAPNINTGTSAAAGVDRDFGIKLSKPTKDIASHDLRDFILHSNTRTPLLHAVANSPLNATSASFSYTHDLPYDPMFLAYIKNATVTGAYTMVNNFAGLTTSGKNINVVLDTSLKQQASLVILKDPFEL